MSVLTLLSGAIGSASPFRASSLLPVRSTEDPWFPKGYIPENAMTRPSAWGCSRALPNATVRRTGFSTVTPDATTHRRHHDCPGPPPKCSSMADDGQTATDVGHWTHEAQVTSLTGASCCTGTTCVYVRRVAGLSLRVGLARPTIQVCHWASSHPDCPAPHPLVTAVRKPCPRGFLDTPQDRKSLAENELVGFVLKDRHPLRRELDGLCSCGTEEGLDSSRASVTPSAAR
jgi:hypothetical protein